MPDIGGELSFYEPKNGQLIQYTGTVVAKRQKTQRNGATVAWEFQVAYRDVYGNLNYSDHEYATSQSNLPICLLNGTRHENESMDHRSPNCINQSCAEHLETHEQQNAPYHSHIYPAGYSWKPEYHCLYSNCVFQAWRAHIKRKAMREGNFVSTICHRLKNYVSSTLHRSAQDFCQFPVLGFAFTGCR